MKLGGKKNQRKRWYLGRAFVFVGKEKWIGQYVWQEKAKERCQIIKYEELTDYCHKLLKNLCKFTIIF